MTPSQAKAIEYAKKTIFESDSYGYPDKHEFKKWEVKVTSFGKIEIISVIGRKNDKGTWNEVLNRSRRQIFVGKRGGFTLCNPAKYIGEEEDIKKVPLSKWVKGVAALWHLAQ